MAFGLEWLTRAPRQPHRAFQRPDQTVLLFSPLPFRSSERPCSWRGAGPIPPKYATLGLLVVLNYRYLGNSRFGKAALRLFCPWMRKQTVLLLHHLLPVAQAPSSYQFSTNLLLLFFA